jgi:hypothetical protein
MNNLDDSMGVKGNSYNKPGLKRPPPASKHTQNSATKRPLVYQSDHHAGARSEDEQSDFKTTTLRFTNNNFVIDSQGPHYNDF